MVNATIGFGGALMLVGIAAFAITAGASVTALIPAILGVVILGLGFAARQWPRAAGGALALAALVALLAVGGSFRGLGGFVALVQGHDVARPVAVVAQTLTLLLGLAYLVVLARRWQAERARG
jgi:hypothetical protein